MSAGATHTGSGRRARSQAAWLRSPAASALGSASSTRRPLRASRLALPGTACSGCPRDRDAGQPRGHARQTRGDLNRRPAMMADVEEVEVVVAHQERATLRVGDVFLKIDADQTRVDVEVEAMALAPIPTPEVLWRKPPVLAIAAVP